MALTNGTRLGLYEILAPIGAGGMGEVYRARDTKLKRDVAIKVLLSSLAADEARLARLEREAQVLASLNHPHIAAIYGLEEEQGQPFLVLELVEGPTLAERMQEGPIPLEEALPIAKQMAEALSEAHEKGIIHRDLKPGNVKLTDDGRVKVLDFGLAKALTGDGGEGGVSTDLSQSPTLSRQATAAGVILGTAAYMSPEQAKGKTVDRRTDVWAFGVVLYEMLTGKHLFRGEDVSEILAAVLRAAPDWNALPAETPSSIRRLLRRCLEKDQGQRLDSMRDGRLDIEEAQQSPKEEATRSPRAPRWTLALAGSLVFVVGGLLAWSLTPSESHAPRPVTRFSIALGSVLFGGFGRVVAISPDGKHVVYVGNQALHLRAMDSDEFTPIAGTEGARGPFFSPDGQWVGFSVGGQLKKVSLSGGAPITLCDMGGAGQGPSWGGDDTIVFSLFQHGLYRVSADGGTPELVVGNDVVGVGISSPQLLPGGNALLLTVDQPQGTRVVVYVPQTGEMRVLIERGSSARYVATGHLVYGLDGSLMAAPFDLERLEVTGGAVPLVDDVMMSLGITQYDVSETGSLAYAAGGARDYEGSLVWVERNGVERPISVARQAYDRPRLSPNGRQLAIQINTAAGADVWVMELARSALTRLTFDGGFRPIWAPDGNSVFYGAVASPGIDIFSTPADGSGSANQITEGAYRIPDSFTPDGKTLVFRQQGGEGGRNIGVLSLGSGGVPEILLGSRYDELHGAVSPGGKWLAYTSDESGEREVYVQSFPGLGNKRKVSVDGGTEPGWSTDGTELFYRSGDAMMVVAITAGSELELSRPVQLFEGSYVGSPDGVSQSYDVASDGRFVMVRREEQTESPQKINIVLNWFSELKARVPTK